MLCKCHWIVLYTVHFTAFCLGGGVFSGHGVHIVAVIGYYRTPVRCFDVFADKMHSIEYKVIK